MSLSYIWQSNCRGSPLPQEGIGVSSPEMFLKFQLQNIAFWSVSKHTSAENHRLTESCRLWHSNVAVGQIDKTTRQEKDKLTTIVNVPCSMWV